MGRFNSKKNRNYGGIIPGIMGIIPELSFLVIRPPDLELSFLELSAIIPRKQKSFVMANSAKGNKLSGAEISNLQ
jgi:hypothetical protein